MSRQRSLELKRKSALIYFSKYVRPPEGYFFLEAIPKEVFGLHPVKKLHLEHKMQRLQNVTEYKVNKSKKARVSRLITRGAAIECICKDVELLDKAEFFLLAERIFSDPVLRDEIAKMVVGRRERAEAGEAELQSTIEDLKEAGYWKSRRKE